ncbi:MAG: baseplate J/gp47 family protein, partial [Ktedonobacteraceae bacterium]|nr:baseplate J/gp47 family protein [Ktedonobacteraceae bacterium]
ETDEDDALVSPAQAGTTGGDAPSQQQDDPASPPMPVDHQQKAPASRSHTLPWKLFGCVALIGLLAGTSIAVALSYWLPASITIVPQSREITATTSVTILTSGSGTPDLSRHQITGRALPAITMSQAITVPTTGKGHHEATAASGLITFYNAALVAQRVPAGTLLTGTSEVQVVTDQDAVIPAGSLSVNGHATVPAHAVQAGPSGNLGSGDIYGPCCRANVFATNSAFHGGQLARDYAMVSQQDIDGATKSSTTSLQQSVQAAFTAQAHPDERLITPSSCQIRTHPDHPVGSEAARVSVTVTATCRGLVYQSEPMQQIMEQVLSQQATRQIGTGYTKAGEIHLEITSSKPQTAGKVTLQVKASGTWAAQFTPDQLQHLAQLVSGKTRAEATEILVHEPGIGQVMLHTQWNQDRLPKDAGHIQMSIMYVPITA